MIYLAVQSSVIDNPDYPVAIKAWARTVGNDVLKQFAVLETSLRFLEQTPEEHESQIGIIKDLLEEHGGNRVWWGFMYALTSCHDRDKKNVIAEFPDLEAR